MPMTPDISHIRDEKIWSLHENYKENILNIHLSAAEGGRQHMPIDNFRKNIVTYLIENKREGNVILEYLFEYHDQMLADLNILKSLK